MDNTIEIIGKNCTACRACEQICPKNAIQMKENKEGFLYPEIDKDKCINCGVCLKKCHVNKNEIKRDIEPQFLAIKPTDQLKARNSTSGGLAQIISEYIIEESGYVYGSVLDKDLNVKHIGVNHIEDLNRLRGSKYVISNTEETFKQVKEKLEDGIKILYIGTACQIGGLKSFLGKNYENLYTIDIVCHGVPSEKLFKKYIQSLEKKYKEKILNYEFRNKDKTDWGMGFTAKVTTQNKIKYLKADFDPYYINFLNGNTYRECCYSCKYTDVTKRQADLTIADYWGIEKFRPEFYDKNGVSLCITNTKNGEILLDKVKKFIKVEKTKNEEAIFFNKNLIQPTTRPLIRDNIYNRIDELPPEKYVKSNLKVKKNIKVLIKIVASKKIKMIYKKYFKK